MKYITTPRASSACKITINLRKPEALVITVSDIKFTWRITTKLKIKYKIEMPIKPTLKIRNNWGEFKKLLEKLELSSILFYPLNSSILSATKSG